MEQKNRGQRNAVGVYDDYSGVYGIYDGIPIELYKPSDGEVIVARYNYDELPYDEIYKQHKLLQEAFGDNKVISLPQNISLKQMSKQQLKELLDFLTKTLEELLSYDDK